MSSSNRKWLRGRGERVGTPSHAALPAPAPRPDAEERELVRALCDRDEEAFEWLLDRYYSPMLRLARSYVRSRDEAEEVVQDVWLAVLAGVDRFEGRSSLKTWIFRILVNRARTRARREARHVPFSALERHPGEVSPGGDGQVERLMASQPASALTRAGSAWAPPCPQEGVLAAELRDRIEAAIATLPARQQAVINLRDVEGWSAAETCALLEISEANQRVLLHRARLKVRDALEGYLAPAGPEGPAPVPAA